MEFTIPGPGTPVPPEILNAPASIDLAAVLYAAPHCCRSWLTGTAKIALSGKAKEDAQAFASWVLSNPAVVVTHPWFQGANGKPLNPEVVVVSVLLGNVTMGSYAAPHEGFLGYSFGQAHVGTMALRELTGYSLTDLVPRSTNPDAGPSGGPQSGDAPTPDTGFRPDSQPHGGGGSGTIAG